MHAESEKRQAALVYLLKNLRVDVTEVLLALLLVLSLEPIRLVLKGLLLVLGEIVPDVCSLLCAFGDAEFRFRRVGGGLGVGYVPREEERVGAWGSGRRFVFGSDLYRYFFRK